MSARWVVSGGLKENHWPTRDLKNLPPDRTMLGRAFWTILHTFSVYLPSIPNAEKLAAFRSIFEAIYHVFPCPVCRVVTEVARGRAESLQKNFLLLR